jgi:hypothetical protein
VCPRLTSARAQSLNRSAETESSQASDPGLGARIPLAATNENRPMMRPAILCLLLTACAAEVTVPPAVIDAGPPCEGCADIESGCRTGNDLDACGANGGACVTCDFGRTCIEGQCIGKKSICITMLLDIIGPKCTADAECGPDAWCRSHCCDPVVAVCHAVDRCVPKVASGGHCDHFDGDHQCASGVCDPNSDQCE